MQSNRLYISSPPFKFLVCSFVVVNAGGRGTFQGVTKINFLEQAST